MRPRVAMLTFGCRVNQYETEAMSMLLRPTCDLVDEGADVYILNGCSVTALAEKKARQAARRLRSRSPEAIILVTGCLADSVARGMTAFGLADVIAGNAWKTRIHDAVAQALAGHRGPLPPLQSAPLDCETSSGTPRRIRAYLKIQDGCSGVCAYCRAVQLRGASRSKSFGAALAEGRRLLAAGFPEIILTGVNLAEYAPRDGSLAALAQGLLELQGLARLRLASINVAGLTDELLAVCEKDARFCPHFHVPLQSGDDGVLRAMRRPYTSAEYRETVRRVRERLPHATLGADVIVGFPGEDEAAFDATCRVVEDVGFSNLHVFRFSSRKGTEAASLSAAVPEATARDRAARLASLWRPIRRRVLDARVGKIEDVLTEARRGSKFYGHTAGYLEAAFTSGEPVPAGTVCRVRVAKATEDGLEGVHDHSHGAD